MMQLLAVHNQPHEFYDAKSWVLALDPGDDEDPTVEAAAWLESGFVDSDWVKCFRRADSDPEAVIDQFRELGLNLDRLLEDGNPKSFDSIWSLLVQNPDTVDQASLAWLEISDEEYELRKARAATEADARRAKQAAERAEWQSKLDSFAPEAARMKDDIVSRLANVGWPYGSDDSNDSTNLPKVHELRQTVQMARQLIGLLQSFRNENPSALRSYYAKVLKRFQSTSLIRFEGTRVSLLLRRGHPGFDGSLRSVRQV